MPAAAMDPVQERARGADMPPGTAPGMTLGTTLGMALGVAEERLQDALMRALRGGQVQANWVLLVLHLSRLPWPGALPHHHRGAAALLDDAAGRCTGQVFGLACGDLALLFQTADEGAAVAAVLHTLFQAEPGPATALHSLWPLPREAKAALRYARGTAERRPTMGPAETPGPPVTEEMLRLPLPALLLRQSAVHLQPGAGQRIRLLFREIALGPHLLPAQGQEPGREPGREPDAMPLGRGDVVGRLEQRLLATARDVMRAGPGLMDGLPLHLNLTPRGVMSEGFAQFAAACMRRARQDAGAGAGPDGAWPGVAVELPFEAALSDPRMFVLARERLRLTGMGFVLDHVSHQMLAVSRPAMLEPRWLKLDWDTALPGAPGARAGIDAFGASRVVLAGCGTEAAIAWGLEQGIQRFQGEFVDSMLAAERLRTCPVRAACSVPQCRARAAALEEGGRDGCRNRPLLDSIPAEPAGPLPMGAS